MTPTRMSTQGLHINRICKAFCVCMSVKLIKINKKGKDTRTQLERGKCTSRNIRAITSKTGDSNIKQSQDTATTYTQKAKLKRKTIYIYDH